jgi:hypothetical protein
VKNDLRKEHGSEEDKCAIIVIKYTKVEALSDDW